MMGNKWMQGGISFGVCIGMLFGLALSAIHPLIPFVIGYFFGFLAMWKCADARGTDGWGGPWNGPKNKKETRSPLNWLRQNRLHERVHAPETR